MIHTLFLHFTHRSFRIWLNIIVANQVEDAMDEIEKGLFIGVGGIVALRGKRRDKNIPQIGVVDWKGDAIGWTWVIKEFSM